MNFFEEQQRFYNDSSLWKHLEESYCYFKDQKLELEMNNAANNRFKKFFIVKVLNSRYGYSLNKNLCYQHESGFRNKMESINRDYYLMVKSLYSMFMLTSSVVDGYDVIGDI